MKTDLERANEALAGGRADEASVYAWNELADIGPDDAPELARIARELDDPRLLREIERRGFSTLPAQAEKPEPVKGKPVFRPLRALPALAFVLRPTVDAFTPESRVRVRSLPLIAHCRAVALNAADTRLPATRARSTTQIPTSCPIRPIT